MRRAFANSIYTSLGPAPKSWKQRMEEKDLEEWRKSQRERNAGPYPLGARTGRSMDPELY